jgi:hypothetical protein
MVSVAHRLLRPDDPGHQLRTAVRIAQVGHQLNLARTGVGQAFHDPGRDLARAMQRNVCARLGES